MRFHVVSLPHTQTTADFSACAYTTKIVNFCKMMMARGHEVCLYAGEQNEAPCTELVTCIGEAERKAAVGARAYVEAPFDPALPHWREFNEAAIRSLRKQARKGDFLCLIAGSAQKTIADAMAGALPAVEFGVGYAGVFSEYRVFESYAWMHAVYGASGGADRVDGKWLDAVIPGYLDAADFPAGDGKGGYFLFVGRLIDRKGWRLACDIAEATGTKLVVAGPGNAKQLPEGVDYRGVIGPGERAKLMGGAIALLAPTYYLEPFGNVAIEAQACGTPVISTDWGAFTETVIDRLTGFRCRSFDEFRDAVSEAPTLDRAMIRELALKRFALEAIAPRYEAYFRRLGSVLDRDWYGGWKSKPA